MRSCQVCGMWLADTWQERKAHIAKMYKQRRTRQGSPVRPRSDALRSVCHNQRLKPRIHSSAIRPLVGSVTPVFRWKTRSAAWVLDRNCVALRNCCHATSAECGLRIHGKSEKCTSPKCTSREGPDKARPCGRDQMLLAAFVTTSI